MRKFITLALSLAVIVGSGWFVFNRHDKVVKHNVQTKVETVMPKVKPKAVTVKHRKHSKRHLQEHNKVRGNDFCDLNPICKLLD